MQNDETTDHHVDDLGYDTSDQKTAASIEKRLVTAIACGRKTGNSATGDLNEDTGKVRSDEDVGVPLCLQLGVLLATVQNDVLENHGDGSRDEGWTDEKTGKLH